MSLCFSLQCLSLYLFLISILSQWIMEISCLEGCLTHLRVTIATRKVTAGCKNTVVLEFIHCNHGLPCPSTTRLEVLCVGRKVQRSTVQRWNSRSLKWSKIFRKVICRTCKYCTKGEDYIGYFYLFWIWEVLSYVLCFYWHVTCKLCCWVKVYLLFVHGISSL